MKVLLRNLKRYKQDTLFNIIGLSVCFTVVILFIGYITKELNTGKSKSESEHVYRIQSEKSEWLSKKVFDLILDKFPEIEAQTCIHDSWSENHFFEVDNKFSKAEGVFFADAGFFKVFQHEAIAGDLKTALNNPNAIVLTQSSARKLFGTTNVIGKTLKYKTNAFGEFNLTVSAVIKDLPKDVLLRFNAIIPHIALHKINWYAEAANNWGAGMYQVFIRTQSQINTTNLEHNIFNLIKQNADKFTIDEYKSIKLAAFSGLYFDNTANSDFLAHNNMIYIYILSISTLFIILLACVNYINLFTAQLGKRLNKFGIKKTLGATKLKVVMELAGESVVIIITSFLISILLVIISLNVFNDYTHSALHLKSIFIKQSGFIILGVLFFITALCGILPGFFIAIKNPVILIKQNTTNANKGLLRNSLLVFQFGISIVFIFATLFINKQTRFILSQNKGIQTENIIYMELNESINRDVLHQELQKISNITAITYASEVVGKLTNTHGKMLNVAGDLKQINYWALQVDSSFFNFFGIQFIEGGNFNSPIPGKDHIIFNQTAKKEFGINQIHEANLMVREEKRDNVIGIVKDFNFKSLHYPIQALGFNCKKPQNLDILYLKIRTNNSEQVGYTLEHIKAAWKKIVPDWPFKYEFLDQSFSHLYEKEQEFLKIFLWTTVISIFIACLGILGVATFTMQQRTKEIGVRKINGASATSIMTLLNGGFVKLVLIAFVIACPIAYFAMNRWLQTFAYRSELSWWIFAMAGLIAMFIALATVSWQSWRAATRNPVESLKNE